jgi:branched-chain amino acid transport system ATP-binding protein
MLEVRELVGGYGTTPSVVALLGANGAGKSTTLRMISGLLRPTSGSVTFDGVDMTSMRSASRVHRGLCHLPEGRGVFPSLSVRENLVLFSPRGQEADAFDAAVEAFPILGERRKQLAGTLSGGEQQMLTLARAYVSRPKIVLVDEASLGLAPLIVDAIFEFLERMVAEGMSLLIVEQYVQRALAIASTVNVLHKGEIVWTGPSAELDQDMLFALYAGESVAGRPS